MIPIDQVQSHTNDRSVALSIKAAKLSSRLLAKAMLAFLRRARNPAAKRGEQSIKSLAKSGASIENVEIPDDIKAFRKTARKYNMDFALKKDKSTDPPSWIVFFKSKDSRSMEAAFKEFSKKVLDAGPKVPTMQQEMERFRDIARGHAPPEPKDGRDRGNVEL